MSTRNGNTPIGNYTGYLGPVQNGTVAYGPYKVVIMEGIIIIMFQDIGMVFGYMAVAAKVHYSRQMAV